MNWEIDKNEYLHQLHSSLVYREAGKITKSMGLVFEAHLPGASVGSQCKVIVDPGQDVETGIDAEVIGFKGNSIVLMPFEEVRGIHSDSLVILRNRASTVPVGEGLLGRILDAKGDPIDGKGPLHEGLEYEERSLYARPTDPVTRKMIDEPIDLGVRSINALTTCGKGQRMGIFAGSGVGKSVLMGMFGRMTKADVNVIALIGERSREVREFIERDLGEEGLKRSVVIVATSDASPLLRMRGAFLAATVAEYFRDQSKDVLLLMDSVTRFCMAQREIGLSMGEPPASKGYTPSVFATLPKLLERAGTSQKGSISGLFTVLVEGDEMDDPIADAARSFLDGHVVLSRKLAERGHYPAVDILQSTSRVMGSIADPEQKKWARQVREWLALYDQVEDLVNIGAYAKGSNPKVDQVLFIRDRLLKFLQQDVTEGSSMEETLAQLHGLIRAGEAYLASLAEDRAAQTADPEGSALQYS